MAFTVNGLTVSRGVAVGRAVLVAQTRTEVPHYFVEPHQVDAEITRLRTSRDTVAAELRQLLAELPHDVPAELPALLEVHLMMLTDTGFSNSLEQWISERLYNCEWALVTQLEVLARQFDEMEDTYLRERKADLEQTVERWLRHLLGGVSPVIVPRKKHGVDSPLSLDAGVAEAPLILVAHDISPADLLRFRQSIFAGFVTDEGGRNSHTAIMARSMDIPAVVGARNASALINHDDWLIVDGDAGVVIVDPSPVILAEYGIKRRQNALERERLERLRFTPVVTLDGQTIELQANVELPQDATAAREAGASAIGLLRSEFLFMGRGGRLPDEEEQYAAYASAVRDMNGLPVTIRTLDIGADKPLDALPASHSTREPNPALGLRAIRWGLSEPSVFRTQLRAILRAAAHGPVRIMVPMLGQLDEIRKTLAQYELAREELRHGGTVPANVELGAMIEIPAAAMMVDMFLDHFDFLSIGTNDLIQYTLAVDRSDASVAHLFDALNPAVLRLIASVIDACRRRGKPVSICGEMAGDRAMTRLLLGFGLRTFSMHPAQLLVVKQEILRADTTELQPWAQEVLASNEPALLLNGH